MAEVGSVGERRLLVCIFGHAQFYPEVRFGPVGSGACPGMSSSTLDYAADFFSSLGLEHGVRGPLGFGKVP